MSDVDLRQALPPGMDEQEWMARKVVTMRAHQLARTLLAGCDHAETIEARAIRLWAARTKMAMLDGVDDPVGLEVWMACQHAIDVLTGHQTVPVARRAETAEDIGLVSA